MSPLVMSIMRFTIRMAVVLPQPEGPTSTQISPAGTVSERSSTAAASWPGNVLVTFLGSRPAACWRVAGPSDWAVSGLVTGRSPPELGRNVNRAAGLVVAERLHPAH